MRAILFGILLGGVCCNLKAQSTPEEKLMQTLYAITNLYVDSIPKEAYINHTIAEMVGKLDPFSEYLPPVELKGNEQALGGMAAFAGVGMEGAWKDGHFYVSFVEKKGSAWGQGIRAGDEILSVDGKAVEQLQNGQIFRLLNGEEGSVVNLQIKRGKKPPFERKIVRTYIPSSSVKSAYMIDSETGYLSISVFSKNVAEDFRKQLQNLLRRGMKNLILDIRKNEGGLFDEAVAIADELLDGNKPIVYADGIHMERMTFQASVKGLFEQGRLVVLVNGQTKSAAEILAGALQDWDRGVLVGSSTFGKGMIQDTFPFEDGSALRLTVARYFTPSGRSIQKPYGSGQLSAQSGKAYESLRTHRVLKSEGGIVPDIFVSADTVHFTRWYNMLVYSGVQKQVTRDYVVGCRSELLKKYKTFEAFRKNFDGSALLQEICRVAEEANIVFSEEEYERSKNFLQVQVKALVARELFNENEYYYRILNFADPFVQKACEIMNTSEDYRMILKENN